MNLTDDTKICLCSVFLGNIKMAFERDPKLSNLLLDPFFSDAVQSCQASWREVVATGATLGIPLPTFSTALAFYDGYRSERLPANLIQVCQLLTAFRFCNWGT
jgi:6-phosphogluconate dehydrogenase